MISPASLDPSSGLLPNAGVDGHVPHMICKQCYSMFHFWSPTNYGSLWFFFSPFPVLGESLSNFSARITPSPLTHPVGLEPPSRPFSIVTRP